MRSDRSQVAKMYLLPATLLDGIAATGAGGATATDPRAFKYGGIPASVVGITTATVKIQGNIALNGSTPATDDSGWVDVDGAEWTSDGGKGLFIPFPYIRGFVSSHTAGTITMKVGL